MELFDKFKKKQPIFIHDEKYDEFYVEINDIKFICEKVEDNYEQLAKDLSNAYNLKYQTLLISYYLT